MGKKATKGFLSGLLTPVKNLFARSDTSNWVPDNKRTECKGLEGYPCGRVFTTWWRKHHCRRCNEIFCSECAPSPDWGYFRTCIDCPELKKRRLLGNSRLINRFIRESVRCQFGCDQDRYGWKPSDDIP